jgi:diguanylate cyclase (GGDEF)-like protein
MGGTSHTLLVIDDDPEDRMIYRELLENTDATIDVREADSCRQGLVELRARPVDCLLLDYRLSDMDGLAFLQVLEREGLLEAMAVVMLTGLGDERVAVEAMKRGCQDYLVKRDLDTDSLIHAIKGAVDKHVETTAVQADLLRMATIDPLTSMYNRGHITVRLDEEIERGKRYRTPLSIALLDVDRFKAVNDRYGHGVGDRLLQSYSELLHKRLRTTDCVGRWGGEEFLLLLPNTDLRKANTLCMRLVNEIAEHPHKVNHSQTRTLRSTCSMGLAELRTEDQRSSFIERADRALYRAKDQGRNQVCMLSAGAEKAPESVQ